MIEKKIIIIFIGFYGLFFLCKQYPQAQTISFQERLNLEIDVLFRRSRQKISRSITSMPAVQKCATPLLKRARKYQELLNPENKFILYRPTDEGSPYYYQNDPYYGDVDVHSYVSPGGHFRLYYTNDNTYGDAVRDFTYVYKFACYFEQAWFFIINTLGYRPPIAGDEKVEVFIMDISYYGVTCYDGDDRGLYIIVNKDYQWARDNLDNEGTEAGAMKVTAVHEFFHVVQAEYYYWPDTSIVDNMWWEENTAVWMEDELYDYVNDYLGYLGWPYRDVNDNGRWNDGEEYFILGDVEYYGRDLGWFDYPEISLDKTSWDCTYDYFEYGGVVWAKFLSENFGRATIRTVFEQFPYPEYSYSALDGIKGAIECVGQETTSFSEAFIKFKLANLCQDYEEGNKYPVPFHEGSISGYPLEISDPLLSHLSAKYYALHKPLSGSETIRISFESEDWSTMALLAVPADSYDFETSDPNFTLFGAAQRISLENEQNGEYYYSFSENPSCSKLIVIPINLDWVWPASYSLDVAQVKESLLPAVPQVVQIFSEIRDQQPIVHLGWRPVQDVEQFQIWRGIKANYQSLIYQSTYDDANSYEDSDNDFLYPGRTYRYQIKFINVEGTSSSEIIELKIPQMPFCPFDLQADYEYMAETQAPYRIKVSFKINGEEVSGHDLTYQIAQRIEGTTDLPITLKSKTPIEFSDEKIVDIVYYDDVVLQYTEYTYIITIFDETTENEAEEEVTVTINATDIEVLLKQENLNVPFEPSNILQNSSGSGGCFISGIALSKLAANKGN